MAAKINRHRYGTNLRHCRPMHNYQLRLNSTTRTRPDRTRPDKVRGLCLALAKFQYTGPTGPARIRTTRISEKLRWSGRVRVVEFSYYRVSPVDSGRFATMRRRASTSSAVNVRKHRLRAGSVNLVSAGCCEACRSRLLSSLCPELFCTRYAASPAHLLVIIMTDA